MDRLAPTSMLIQRKYLPVTAPSRLRIRSGLKIFGSMSLALTPMRSDCRSPAAQWVTQPQILQR